MTLLSKAPKTIWNQSKKEYELFNFKKFSTSLVELFYMSVDDNEILKLIPSQVETQFFRQKPIPIQSPVLQGKYECAPAALAMVLGEKLFTIKRQMAKLQWRNDDSGVNDYLLRETARAMGRDLIEVPISNISHVTSPCILTVNSLNVPGYNHAIAWTGTELLDPNTNYPDRHYWGSDWSLDMVEAKCCHTLLSRPLNKEENIEYINFLRNRKEDRIKQIIIDFNLGI